ncbi:hypothetical protein HK100_001207 [Physocladia obscura]|uniref:Uncharacterized protein n=1 Tax=Physocladia obscura TaxID=109957 RepID=A0AAD5XC00_9FUNG|nr:hypothetical protein HK100_001207 [Physocladia obscura]
MAGRSSRSINNSARLIGLGLELEHRGGPGSEGLERLSEEQLSPQTFLERDSHDYVEIDHRDQMQRMSSWSNGSQGNNEIKLFDDDDDSDANNINDISCNYSDGETGGFSFSTSEGENESEREVWTLDRLTSSTYSNIMRQYLVADGGNLVATPENIAAGSSSNGGVGGNGKGNLELPSLVPTQSRATTSSATQLNAQLPQPPIVAQTQSLPQKSYQFGQQFGQMTKQHHARVRAVSPAPPIVRATRLASPFKQQQQPMSPNLPTQAFVLTSTTSATTATTSSAAVTTISHPARQRSSTTANISSAALVSASPTTTTIPLEAIEKDVKPSFKKTMRHITSIFVNNNNNSKQQQETASILTSAVGNVLPPVVYLPPSTSPTNQTNPAQPPGSFAHLRHASSASSGASTAASAELVIRSRFQIKVTDDDASSSFSANGGPSEWFRKFTKRSSTPPPPIVFSNNRFRSGSVKSRSSIKSNGTTKSNGTAKTYTAGEHIGQYYGNIGDEEFALMIHAEMHPLPPGAAAAASSGNLGNYGGYAFGTNSGMLPVGGKKNLKHSQSLPSAIA